MLSNVANVLNQLATALTTGTLVTAVATIAIAVVGFMWAMGYLGFRLAAGVVLGSRHRTGRIARVRGTDREHRRNLAPVEDRCPR